MNPCRTRFFDRDAAVKSALPSHAKIKTFGDTKVVGCLIRGLTLPYTYSVSGYGFTPHQLFEDKSEALNQKEWTDNVFALASIMCYPLKAHRLDGGNKPSGSYLACHAEKQLLTYLVWDHANHWGIRSSENNVCLERGPTPSAYR